MIALTPGEPAGIGPDLVIQNAKALADCVVIADADMLLARASELGVDLSILAPDAAQTTTGLRVHHLPCLATVTAGRLDTANAGYVLRTLEHAIDGCLANAYAGLVTGPVQKSVIIDAGHEFSGHTELLRDRAGAHDVVMMLAAGSMRVTLATTHLPLRAVPDSLTRELIERRLRIVHAALSSQFGVASPRIGVCGLNPHAGEGGHLGVEEIDVIAPACRALRAEGIDVSEPLPADTLFTKRQLAQFDAVFAMYHDQGLPVLKHAGFGDAVNVTLGLPFVRTSVDHGTALDLAGSGQADSGSLLAAVALARTLAKQRLSA